MVLKKLSIISFKENLIADFSFFQTGWILKQLKITKINLNLKNSSFSLFFNFSLSTTDYFEIQAAQIKLIFIKECQKSFQVSTSCALTQAIPFTIMRVLLH